MMRNQVGPWGNVRVTVTECCYCQFQVRTWVNGWEWMPTGGLTREAALRLADQRLEDRTAELMEKFEQCATP